MNFNELMNDDTCQILLAIIVGIVICYFIFGSGSGSSGSCNRRDGFSVGATCENYSADLTTNCATEDANGNSIISANEIDGDTISSECENALISYQTQGGPNYCDINNSSDFPNGNDAFHDAVRTIRARRSGTHAPCRYRTGEARCSGNKETFPLRVNCVYDSVTEGCTSIDTSLPTGAGGQSLLVEEIREMNIIGSIKNMIQKVALGPSNQSIIDDLNIGTSTASDATFNKLFQIGQQVDMEFIILINTPGAVSPLNRYYFSTLIDYIDIKPSRGLQNQLVDIKLGNMFDPYARLSTEIKKEIFCSKNTLTTSNGQEKYDLLLKMRSTDEDDLSANIDCSDQSGWVGTDNFYDIIDSYGASPTNLNYYKNILRQIPQDPLVTQDPAKIISDGDMNSRISEVFDPNSISSGLPSYNMNQMVITSKSNIDTFDLDKPDYIELEIKNSITNPRGSGTYAQVNSGNTPNNYKLLFIDGMSSNGTPYNERIDAFNNYNIYNAYYKNLFYVQYLILKIFLGTDKYLPQSHSFLKTDPEKRNSPAGVGRAYGEPLPFWSSLQGETAATNSMCTESGRDYLVLGLLKTSGSYHGHIAEPDGGYSVDHQALNSIDKNGTIIEEYIGAGPVFNFSQQSETEYLKNYPILVGDAPDTPNTTVACDAYARDPLGGSGNCDATLKKDAENVGGEHRGCNFLYDDAGYLCKEVGDRCARDRRCTLPGTLPATVRCDANARDPLGGSGNCDATLKEDAENVGGEYRGCNFLYDDAGYLCKEVGDRCIRNDKCTLPATLPATVRCDAGSRERLGGSHNCDATSKDDAVNVGGTHRGCNFLYDDAGYLCKEVGDRCARDRKCILHDDL